MDKVQPLISAGKDDEALKALDRFLTIEPTNAEGYFLTGTIYHRKGDEEASINSLKTAIFWKNKHIQSHILLARIYISKGECASAQSHAKTALEIDPNNQEAIGLQKLLETGKCR
jgi:Tfp pilus assembly protein PilF